MDHIHVANTANPTNMAVLVNTAKMVLSIDTHMNKPPMAHCR